jgi:RHS repeat-associated protein
VHRPHPQIPLKHQQSNPAVCSAWDKGYRHGFNSMEKDNEINVNGGDYDFGARIYDSRLGRWLSLDPVRNSSWSSYASFKNSPIAIIDPNGETDFYNQGGDWIGTDGNEATSGEIKIITDRKVLKQIEKTSNKGENYTNELPNGTFYKLPEKKVLDAIVAVFDASQKDVIGDNGNVIAKGGEHESGTTFDNNGNQTPIVNGPQMNKNTSAEINLPEYGTISIHAHIMETAENRLHNKTNANEYGPSTKDISSFINFTSNIIIQPNANLEIYTDPLTKEKKAAPRKWVVSTYTAKVEKVNGASKPVATLVNETDYSAIKKIQSGEGKKESKTYKKYEAKRKKD